MSEEEDSETHFNNAVRENIVCLILFLFLYSLSSFVISLFWQNDPVHTMYLNNEELVISKIIFALTTLSLAVCFASAIMLPFSIVSNEILIIYPNNEYLNWLNTSLIHSIWNYIFLFSYCCLFIFLPFAYLFAESIGFNYIKKGVFNCFYETFLTCLLYYIIVVGISWLIFLMVYQNSSYKMFKDIFENYLPFLYHSTSLVGVLTLLICTPIGFIKIFDVIGNLIIKSKPFFNLEKEKTLTHLQNMYLKQKIELKNVTKSNFRYEQTREFNYNFFHPPHAEEPKIQENGIMELSSQYRHNDFTKPLLSNGVISADDDELLVKLCPNSPSKSNRNSNEFQRSNLIDNTKKIHISINDLNSRYEAIKHEKYYTAVMDDDLDARRPCYEINTEEILKESRLLSSFVTTRYDEKKHSCKLKAKMRHLNTVIAASFWKRNLNYPIVMLILFFLTGISLLLVGFNCLKLLMDEKALPSFSKHINIGNSSLSLIGPFGAFLQIIIIGYLKIASIIGVFSVPLFKRIRPKVHSTPYSKIIFICGLLLIHTSAFPVFSRTLGITNFDLIGHFGRLQWLGNFYLILGYNLAFVFATAWCMMGKFTQAILLEFKINIQ